MKKVIGILMILLMLLGLVACGTDDTEFEGNGEIYVDQEWDIYPTEHILTSPIEIDFWSANSAVDLHGSEMADMVQDFNEYQKATYPNSYIKVNAAFQGGYTVQNTKLQAALIGGTNPELAMIGVSSLAIYPDNVIDQRKIFTYDMIRDVYEGFLQFAMCKNVFVGYPYFSATNVLLLNRTLAEKTGMKVPTTEEILADPENSIWTWEYAKSLFKAISDLEGGGKYYGMASAGPAIYEAYFSQGVAPYNANASKQQIDTPEGKKAFEYWRSLVVDGCMKNPVLDPNHGTKIQGEFSQGTVGALYTTSSVIKTVFENVTTAYIEQGQEPLFEMDVLPNPKYSQFYSNQSGGAIIVFNNKSEARTQAAIEFLRWLQAPEQVARFSTNTGYLASTKSSALTEKWIEYKAINPLLDRAISLMVFAPKGDLKLPIGRAKALADADFSNYIKGIYYDNCTRDINEVLKECADRIQYILEENSW